MLYGTEYMKPNSHNGSVFISLLKIQNTVVKYYYSYKYADCQITFKMSQEKQHTSVAYSLWKWKQFMHEIHVSIATGHYIAYWFERVYDHLSDPGFLKPLKVIFDGLNVSVYLLFPLRRQRLSKKVEDQRFSISTSVMTFWFCIQVLETVI